MTEEFISRVSILDEMSTGSIYQKLDIIESAIHAIDEGIMDNRTVLTTLSYTQSVYLELLENVKTALLKLVQQALSALNSYYMNNAKLCQKYRNVIAKGLEKTKYPITHETYEYPDTKGYPRPMRSASVETDVARLQKDITNGRYTSEEVAYRVDQMVEDFGKKVLDLSPDPWELKDSVTDIVTKRYRGNKTTSVIDINTLDEWIKSITEYRKDREDLQSLKKSITEDYEMLKKTMASATKPDRMVPGRTALQQAYDPEAENFYRHEYARFSDIHTEMMRLFKSYIEIYKVAFSTKLSLLDEKVNDQRNTLNEVMMRTGTLAAINPKSPVMDSNKPIPYNPQPVS